MAAVRTKERGRQMMTVNRLLEGYDLSGIYTVIALLGVLLAVYVMQKTRYEAEDRADPVWLRNLRTGSLGLLALGLLWSLSYAEAREFQPWPAQVLMVAALDLLFAIRALAILIRVRREGRYLNAPSMREAVKRELSRR